MPHRRAEPDVREPQLWFTLYAENLRTGVTFTWPTLPLFKPVLRSSHRAPTHHDLTLNQCAAGQYKHTPCAQVLVSCTGRHDPNIYMRRTRALSAPGPAGRTSA